MSADGEVMWAAGFWDGEGCAYAGTDGHLRLSLTNCNRGALVRFQQAVGAGNINGPYQTGKANWRPMWQWRLHGERARPVVRLLLPNLCDEKRAQIARIYASHDDGQLALPLEKVA